MSNLSSKLTAAALIGAFAASAQAFDLEHGKQLSTSCAACHGADFKSPTQGTGAPILAGQYADYLEHALMTYKHGTNPMMGRNNAIMDGMAVNLSDKDVADLAGYIASLPGPLVQKK